jgi:hypothetical protein
MMVVKSQWLLAVGSIFRVIDVEHQCLLTVSRCRRNPAAMRFVVASKRKPDVILVFDFQV